MIKVSIVEDDNRIRESLAVLIDGGENIRCISTHATAEEALAQIPLKKPDVVLMDISMPVLDGIEAARQIHDALPGAQVLMLTGSAARQDIAKSRKAAASGYVTKDRIAAELIEAIVEVAGR